MAENIELQELLELLQKKSYAQLRQKLDKMNPSDISETLEELYDGNLIAKEELPLLFRILPKETATETFVEMSAEMQEILIQSFSDNELREVMDDMFLDDTVAIIEEMPAIVVKRILKNVDPATRKTINQVLNYPEDSAGSIMTIEYVSLKKDATVQQAFDHIRKTGVDKETIYTCYVTDPNRKLIGLVTVRELLLSNNGDLIGDIMEKNIISVTTLDDQEHVARIFNKYNFYALPVVDQENRLVGIITVDDVLDIMEEEATEDIEIMAALVPSDKPYLKTGVVETWKKRIPWLLILMISATFTGLIITSFEEALSASVVLTAFIPMLMDTGGNSGSQSSVTIIRSLSLNDIELSDIFRITWKEARVAVLCGLTLAAANFVKLMLIDRTSLQVAFVVCSTLIVTVFIAKLVGCTLPLLAKKIGFDPAVMASPFITTIVDAISLLVYFNIAKVVLHL
ncbi:MAG: magnesium transporter [Peptococcaceae bacterium]|nr:magnesium transporter [Peptococcaceae bacterium]